MFRTGPASCSRSSRDRRNPHEWMPRRTGRTERSEIRPAASRSDVNPPARRGRALDGLAGVQVGLDGWLAPDLVGLALDGVLDPRAGVRAESIALEQAARIGLALLAPELAQPCRGLIQLAQQ